MALDGDSSAPTYAIPPITLLCVEHPFKIESLDKCLESLGGDSEISKLLNPQENVKPINLHLRPQDQLSAPVTSIPVLTENVLLKITVPKRTGRKRIRGSSDEFAGDVDIEAPRAQYGLAEGNQSSMRINRINCRQLRRSLNDNVSKFEVEALGSVQLTHRWRSMPDFVYSTSQSALAHEFRKNIFPFDFLKIKQFNHSNAINPDRADDLIPPPSFSTQNLPFIYGFRQNPAMKHIISTEDGTIQAINTQAPPKTHSHVVAAHATSIPTTAHPRCSPITSLDPRLLRSISQINYLLTTRPVWTRRGLINCLPEHNIRYLAKHAIPYCGYHFSNGPWRDCIVKFGVDPRTSPDYRRYQTLIFKLDRTTAFGSNAPAVQGKGKKSHARKPQNKALKDDISHIFDGHSVSKDGKTWAICDITDTFLAKILSTKNIRETCDLVSDGWYHNGTLAKVRVIMRAKIQRILEGREYSDVEFGRLLAIPESITSENKKGSALIPKGATSEELFWASRIRSTALVRFDATGKKVRMDGEADGDYIGGGNEDDDPDVEGEETGDLEDSDEALGGDDGNGNADEDDPDEIVEDDVQDG